MMIRHSGTGFDPDGVANTEADHFGNRPVCAAYIDMRDLAQILAHVHDAETEIGVGPGAAAPRPVALELKEKPASQ
jgi:hypothetical protein